MTDHEQLIRDLTFQHLVIDDLGRDVCFHCDEIQPPRLPYSQCSRAHRIDCAWWRAFELGLVDPEGE